MNDLGYCDWDTKKLYPLCDECLACSGSGYENEFWKLCPPGCFTRKCEEKMEQRRKKKKSTKNFVFITINDLSTRMKDLENLKMFIKKISYMYTEGYWVIETGKNKEEKDFNVHVHLLVKIKDCIKNHKKTLNAKWMSVRDTSLYDKDYYLLKQWRKSDDMCDYDEFVDEKLAYFDNDKKGEHKNTMDLKLNGQFGTPEG